MAQRLRLGVNIDHVATLRNARGGAMPDPVRAAIMAQAAGADGITAHLREDRRHIQDEDVRRLRQWVSTRLNLEMAATDAMIRYALDQGPDSVSLVPENPEEVTTEPALDVVAAFSRVEEVVAAMSKAGIQTSLFIDPDPEQVEQAAALKALGQYGWNYRYIRDAAYPSEFVVVRTAAAPSLSRAVFVPSGV